MSPNTPSPQDKFSNNGKDPISRIETLEKIAKALQLRNTTENDLADISDIYRGDLYTGDGTPSDPEYTGSFISQGGFDFNGVTYHVGSVLAGVLGWGGNEQGQLVAGAGNSIVDVNGFSIVGSTTPLDNRSYKITDGTNVLGGMYGYYTVINGNVIGIQSNAVTGRPSLTYLNSTAPSGQVALVSLLASSGSNSAQIILESDTQTISLIGTSSVTGTLNATGGIGINTSPNISDGVGIHVAGKILRLGVSKTPASATDTGNPGEICRDTQFLYICTANNTWKRAALTTW
jgi:hypothetical protein